MSYENNQYEVELQIILREKVVIEAENQDEAESEAFRKGYDIARFAGCNDYDVYIENTEEL